MNPARVVVTLNLFLLVACAKPVSLSTIAAVAPSACRADDAVVNWWPGEYPAPVLHVLEPVTIQARAEICDPKPSLPCTLPVGLVHPWAAGGVRFASIQAVSRYRVLQAVEIEGESGPVAVAHGSVVEERAYMSEGWCLLVSDGVEFSGWCPGNGGQEELFARLETSEGDRLTRQLAGFQCPQGYTGWVEITDDLAQIHGLTWGSIVSYGEVGPELVP